MKRVSDTLSHQVVLYEGIPVSFNCARRVKQALRIIAFSNWAVYEYEGSIKTAIYDHLSTPLRMFVKDHLEVVLLNSRKVEK